MPYQLPLNVGRPSAAAQRLVLGVIRPLSRLAYRPTIEGTEHLPTGRPYLLVANHSAGVAIAELTSFASLFLERFGDSRALTGFAHPTGFRIWPLNAIHRHLGSIPSTYEAADGALEQGVPILVFPGGDHEALRPVTQAHVVDFGGRKGFLKIARKSGVPIVPMGIRGSHFTAPILLRSKWLANVLIVPRLLGTKRWGLSLLGVMGATGLALAPLPGAARVALIWLWLGSPLVFWPIVPWTVRFRIGPPIESDELFDAGTGPEAQLDDALQLVTESVQALVSQRS